MFPLCKIINKFTKSRIPYKSVRRFAVKVTMGDPLEHATGIEKRELLAMLAGNADPYAMSSLKKGPGTRNQPNEVPSAFDSRIVGCVCEEDATTIHWMWVHKGHPKRCECGQWFTLVHRAPL